MREMSADSADLVTNVVIVASCITLRDRGDHDWGDGKRPPA
jgi:hypothetical protein